jgi:putative ABC transport system ATP-binding protein
VDFQDVSMDDRPAIISLSFAYIEPRHRFGLLTEELMARIVDVRQQFHAGLPEDLKDQIEIYDPANYMASASLMDNVVFGRVNNKHADGPERVQEIVRTLLDQLGLYDEFQSIGLDFDVGTGGKRLTLAQRQKLALARALLRRSDYFVFNRTLAALDQRTREQIVENVLAIKSRLGTNAAIIWVLSDNKLSRHFDRVIVFDGPAVKQDGARADLAQKDGLFRELVAR